MKAVKCQRCEHPVRTRFRRLRLGLLIGAGLRREWLEEGAVLCNLCVARLLPHCAETAYGKLVLKNGEYCDPVTDEPVLQPETRTQRGGR